MTSEMLQTIAGRLDRVESVILTGWGEPLFHHDFQGVLDQLRQAQPKIRIGLTTNGFLLDDQVAEILVRHRVSRVSISLDRVTNNKDDVGHQTSQRVIDRIRHLAGLRNTGGPKIVLQSTLRNNSEPDLLEVADLALEINADAINLIRLVDTSSAGLVRPRLDEEVRLVQAVRSRVDSQTPVWYINDYNWPMRIASHNEEVCFRTLFHAYVTVDGDVSPCCLLREVSLGNLQNRTLEQIWSSPAAQRFFHDQERLCRNCDAMTATHRSARNGDKQ